MCYCIVSVVSPMITPINQSGKGGNINGGSLRLVQTCRCPFLLSSGRERSSKYIGLSGFVSGQVPQQFRVWFWRKFLETQCWFCHPRSTWLKDHMCPGCFTRSSKHYLLVNVQNSTWNESSETEGGQIKNFHHLKSSCRRILAARRVDAGSRL